LALELSIILPILYCLSSLLRNVDIATIMITLLIGLKIIISNGNSNDLREINKSMANKT
jgi:hypothetical protein